MRALSVAVATLFCFISASSVACNPLKANPARLAPCPQLPQPRKFGFAHKLDPPPQEYTLKAILLAVGYQRYACSKGTAAAPTYLGAEPSTLYDIGNMLNDWPEVFSSLQTQAGFGAKLDGLPQFGSVSESGQKQIVFSQTKSKDVMNPTAFFVGSVTKRVPAPSPHDTLQAYDWMQFQDANGRLVYRVHTVGEDVPSDLTCDGSQRILRQKYMTQYWFYSRADVMGVTEDGAPLRFCKNVATVLPKGRRQ